MLTLDETFSELRQRLTARDHLTDRTGDPIYYFVFPPEKMQRVKEKIPDWKAKLEVQDGWVVRVFSLAARLLEFLASHMRRKVWLEYERDNPFELDTFRKSLASALTENDEVTNWVRQELTEAAKVPKGLLFLTDLEAVHPFLRIGTVEQALQDSGRN